MSTQEILQIESMNTLIYERETVHAIAVLTKKQSASLYCSSLQEHQMNALSFVELIGFSAAGLTLLAFSQKSMLPMRVSAIGANVCFVLYGALAGLYPVLVLHLLLLPVNIMRLAEQVRSGSGSLTRGDLGHPQRTASLIEQWRVSQRAS